MNSLKRQVSPGAAVVVVVLVLAIVQWAWWRGLIYKPPPKPAGPMSGGGGSAPPSVTLQGHTYVKVDTLAGAIQPGYVDGPGYSARFDRPTGIALDTSGKLYVCDTGNHRIRVVASDGSVSTLAGSDQGFADGPVAQAKFNAPCGICVSPDGAVYVADTGNGKVRCIRNGLVTTVVEQASPAGSASSSLPIAMSFQTGSQPMLLVLDAGLHAIRSYDMNGMPRGSPQTMSISTVVIAGIATDSGYKSAIPAVVQIDGTDTLADVAKRPVVRHLTGWCRIGPGSLLIDAAQGAVLYKKYDSAEVLAGVVSSGGPIREWRDGSGENCLFGSLTCVVTDGVRYAYVSDTSNCCIRRLSLPEFMFH